MSNSNEIAALAYLTDRRDRLRDEIVIMTGRLREIEHLISELKSPVGDGLAGAVHVPIVEHVPTPQRANGAMRPPRVPLEAKFNAILNLIARRGIHGVTCQYLAEAMGTPFGTTSSRLSIMRTKGLVVNKSPLWFVAPERSADDANGDAS